MTSNTPRLSEYLSLPQYRLLRLLCLTMVSSDILVKGRLFRDRRHASKKLRKLKNSGYIGIHQYIVPHTKRAQYFYHIEHETSHALHLHSPQYHEIRESTVFHDSMTAIFITYAYYRSLQSGYQIDWYPPFSVEGKISDGGIALARGKTVFRSMLIETDTGTHDYREIAEKLQAYTKFLTHRKREVIFLVPNDERIRNLQHAFAPLIAKHRNRLFFLNPLKLAFPEIRKGDTREHPAEGDDSIPRKNKEFIVAT